MKRAQMLILYVAPWLLYALITASQKHFDLLLINKPTAWLNHFRGGLPSALFWVLLMPLIFRLGRSFPIGDSRPFRFLAVHLSAALLITFCHDVAASCLIRFLTGDGFAFIYLSPRWLAHYVRDPLPIEYLVVFAGHQFWLARERQHARELEEALARRSLLQAQLSRLKASLQPHFLFNVLQAINVMALRGDSHKVIEMIDRLGGLLRVMLEERERDTVTLSEELAFLDRYLDLEQVRLEDRLLVERAVEDETQPALVPPFCLQPLVENAIKYGIAASSEGGTLRLDIQKRQQHLVLSLENDGPAMGHQHPGTGLGLADLRQRLSLLYGQNFQLEVQLRKQGGALVTLQIPFKLESEGP